MAITKVWLQEDAVPAVFGKFMTKEHAVANSYPVIEATIKAAHKKAGKTKHYEKLRKYDHYLIPGNNTAERKAELLEAHVPDRNDVICVSIGAKDSARVIWDLGQKCPEVNGDTVDLWFERPDSKGKGKIKNSDKAVRALGTFYLCFDLKDGGSGKKRYAWLFKSVEDYCSEAIQKAATRTRTEPIPFQLLTGNPKSITNCFYGRSTPS